MHEVQKPRQIVIARPIKYIIKYIWDQPIIKDKKERCFLCPEELQNEKKFKIEIEGHKKDKHICLSCYCYQRPKMENKKRKLFNF